MYYKISFPADFKVIPAVREMIAHTAMLEGFNHQQAERLRSVTDELCNNAIEHGSQPTSEVLLEVQSDENAMKITCQDQGHGNTLKAADIQKRISGEEPIETGRGRGLKMIVQSFVDELRFEDRKEGGIKATAILKKEHGS